MSKSFLLFFLFIPFGVYAQLLNLQVEWFQNEHFFEEEFIKKHGIRSIYISISDKEDGETFTKEAPFLHYQFDQSASLIQSEKIIHMKNRNDTSIFRFSYNSEGYLTERMEKQGPFSFKYLFFYDKAKLLSELKLNASGDTSQIKYFQHVSTHKQEEALILNSIKKPYMKHIRLLNESGDISMERTAFVRNSSYSETNYQYDENRLVNKEIVHFFGSQNSSGYKYSYSNNQLDFILYYTNNTLTKKYAFTYDEKNLVDAIIERNLLEKSIRIYRFKYEYF